MRKGISLGLLFVVLGCAVFAAVALSAPTNSRAPTISGKPAFGSVLTCNHGTWSADSVSFDYAWVYSGGAPTIATGRTWRVNKGVGYNIYCQVTAHDAQGATTSATSAQVLLTNGISNVRITKVSQSHGNITFTCVAGPSAALKHASFDRPIATLVRRLGKNSDLQLGGILVIRKRNGHFTITGHDDPGRHTYAVNFEPAHSSQYDPSHATKVVTVTR